jgi:hypothetical protein
MRAATSTLWLLIHFFYCYVLDPDHSLRQFCL